jgi:hypothetical protein
MIVILIILIALIVLVATKTSNDDPFKPLNITVLSCALLLLSAMK